MLPNSRSKKRLLTGFTLLELLVVIVLIVIMAGMMVAMLGSFGHRRQLELSAVKLVGDLRQTQQFARVQRDGTSRDVYTYGYRYYGLRFYDSLGEEGDRDGYKIVRYEPAINPGDPGGLRLIELTPPLNLNDFTVIKSSDENDNGGDGPEFLEDTFFGRRVSIDAGSEFQIDDPPTPHTIVFIPEGSATLDGDVLLSSTCDAIILSLDGETRTIQITPLTGHVQIQ